MPGVATTAMILAAGRGERMRPITDSTPKPLLEVGGRSLIERHLIKLAAAGFKRIVINHAHLGDQIVSALGDGDRWNIKIQFSAERDALETAGGIANALQLIDSDAFAVVNSDVFSDYDYARLRVAAQRLLDDAKWLAHLVLVDNPRHNPAVDFALQHGSVLLGSKDNLTFCGLAAYRADMFAALAPGERRALGPMLKTEVQAGRVSGEHYHGSWIDVGTRERLSHANQLMGHRQK